jgi:hypothetical protein
VVSAAWQGARQPVARFPDPHPSTLIHQPKV